jgi:hypothetical protein
MQLDSEPDPAAAGLPEDPFGTQHSHAGWEQQQVADMLQMADVIVGDEAAADACPLSQHRQQQLQDAYRSQFSSSLQQGASPTERTVRDWLRQQLQITPLQYGSDNSDSDMSEGDADAPPDATLDQQQGQQRNSRPTPRGGRRQQQRQQRPQQQQPRRTTRSNAGVPPAEYWRQQQQPDSTPGNTTQRGREGRRNMQHASGAATQPLTPAADNPPQRAGGRARGQP